ncbi:MAG TPA: hypothetical protein VLH79_06755 [Chthonomonadales bacterium]|nr:hypothetical protein [Chthonomonadales bacterium]
MSTDQSRLHVQVFTDRCAWFMTNTEGRLVGHGVGRSLAEVRGVQVRAGIATAHVTGLKGVMPYPDWHHATRRDRERRGEPDAQNP